MRAPLQIRNLRFDTGPAIPRVWHGGRRSVTNFFDNLSVFFPLGERFFVASVRAVEERVKDEGLRATMRAFSGQEGVHAREHARYNEMLAARGYPIEDMERRVDELLRGAARRLPRRRQLAVTCALEHFTALLGQLVLRDPKILEGADEIMASLWRWHALEENEHKAVPFDVFIAVGGKYHERVTVMGVTTVIFWGKVLEHQARMMKVDGTLFSAKEWWALVRFLFIEPGGMGGVVRQYFEYFRPGFHPNDIDSEQLIASWRETFSATDARAAHA